MTGKKGPSAATLAKKELSDDKPYVDKTGTDEKPDPMRDVYLEFPRAMMAIAGVTAFGARKHAPRGWQTFDPEYGMNYHRSKVGRHLLKEETEGPVNHEDGDLLHPAQTVWNMLAYLEHFLKLQEKITFEGRKLDKVIFDEPKRKFDIYDEASDHPEWDVNLTQAEPLGPGEEYYSRWDNATQKFVRFKRKYDPRTVRKTEDKKCQEDGSGTAPLLPQPRG